MGFEGGGGPFWENLWDNDAQDKKEWTIYDHIPPDDPFAKQSMMTKIAKAMSAKFDDKLWQAEEVRPEEIPEELKESGAIADPLEDIEAAWTLAFEAELQALFDTGAVEICPKNAENGF